MVVALAALLGACGRADAPGAAADDYVCDLTYSMQAGPLLIESQARIAFDLNLTPLANTYTVRELTVTEPWTGRSDVNPWRLFIVGRERPVAAVTDEVITLFETKERPFTINRINGDAGWNQSGPMGETEYYGGCEAGR